MEVREIGKRIDEIIEKRKSRLPEITAKMDGLQQMEQVVSLVKALRAEMISEDGEILEGGRFTHLLKMNLEMAWPLKEIQFDHVIAAIEKAKGTLSEYSARCSRERINISAVGMARIGKSELLKAISGLNNYVIPAFDSSDCTGAPSIINNVPGASLTARLTFKTPEAMRQMAQTYLDRMIPDLEKRPILRSMNDILGLSLDDVKKAMVKGSTESILLPYLEKMVKHYDEWSPLAGKEPTSLTDEKEIMTYVAQNNGVPLDDPVRKREEYFRYLAVDTCVIDCNFPDSEMGKITLIDTVGLGDHTIGILDNMLETIKSQSDAVIFVHNPRDGTGDGLPEPVTKVYDGIYKAYRDKKLDDWLYFLINHVSHPTKKLAQNTEFCNSALRRLQNAELSGSKNAKIIDVTDVDAVRYEFLVPLLEGIAVHLDEIDEVYRVPAEEDLRHLRTVYNGFCVQIKKALQSNVKRDENLIRKLQDKTTDCLRTGLYQLVSEWRKSKDMPCVRLDKSAKIIFRHMSDQYDPDTYLPSEDYFREMLQSGETALALYERSANSIRNKVMNAFLDLDQEVGDIITEMKGSVAKAMYDGCGLRKLCEPPADGRPAGEWLKDFSEMVLGDGQKYPSIKLAIDTLVKFDFSAKAFLIYEVRDCLDALDPHISTVTPVVSGDAPRDARYLYYQLYPISVRIAQQLEKRLSEVLVRPNRAVAAALMDFLDRVYYGDGVLTEWNDLLSANDGLLWADQLREQQRTSALFDEWMDIIEKLQSFNQASFYQL